jgi:hypothetical protein
MITNKDVNSSRDVCNSRKAQNSREVSNGKDTTRSANSERRLQEPSIECQQQHRCHKQWERLQEQGLEKLRKPGLSERPTSAGM